MKLTKTLTALAVGLSLLGAGAAASAKPPKTRADHTALAEKYDKMAADQEAVVKEHTEMKKDYQGNQAMLPKATREKSLAEMDAHCDAIITEARKLGDEYRAMARWHEMRAEEFGRTPGDAGPLAAKPPKTAADHRARGEKYAKMAVDQEAVVKEHTEMKKDYQGNQAMLPKATREKSLAEMDAHCDAIITEARKLGDEYRAMARWHEMRAEEMK